MTRSNVVYVAAVSDSVFTILTFCLYIYKRKTSLSYVNDVFEKANYSAQRQRIEKTIVVLIEILTLASHGALNVILFTENKIFIDFFIEEAAFLGGIISLNIGMVLWPVFIEPYLAYRYPDITDLLEALCAIASIFLITIVLLFKSPEYTEYIYIPVIFIAAKFAIYDFWYWGTTKRYARRLST